MARRKIEVFVTACPLCEEALQLVQSLACPDCEVIVYDLNKEGVDKAEQYGVNSVPTVVVDGELAPCCPQNRPTAEDLRAVGLGRPI